MSVRPRSLVLFLLVLITTAGALWYGSAASAGPVPDTRQTNCYNTGSVITCPNPGESFYGQDASYTINPPSYTKLDASGNTLPDSASSWVMVRDNVTGLIWEVKQNKDGVKNYSNPHDADNTYTWYDSNPATNGGYAGTPGNGTDTQDFIAALNNQNFGGFSDWRLPTRKELRSIVDYGRYDPSVHSAYFINMVAANYWSSTSRANGTNSAWNVYFYYGFDDSSPKSNSRYVLAVRGEQRQNQFVDNQDGTITDTSTGLIWQKNTAPGTYTWAQALSYCENLVLPAGGYSDWRLPTIKELDSIVDLSRYNPAINTTFFPDTRASYYWSSTTYVLNTAGAWAMDFNLGHNIYGNYKSTPSYVRAVRGGRPGSLGDLGIFKGVVAETDSRGLTLNPPANATVQVSGAGSGTTNNQGEFWFTTLDPGTYTVTVSKTGYYPVIRQIQLKEGNSEHEVFYLTSQQSGDPPGTPAAYDFQSPQGNHFIEGMPGTLTFSTMVAWNGSPGSVRFKVAGQWHTTTTTDIGGGLAKAELTIAAPTSIGACSELTVEVTNAEGKVTRRNMGVHFSSIPGIIIPWYGDNIIWTPSGFKLTYSTETTSPGFFLPEGFHIGPLPIEATLGEKTTLSYDLLAAAFGGEKLWSLGVKFKTGYNPVFGRLVSVLGEAKGSFGGGLGISLAGCDPPVLTPYWHLGVSGKFGVGVPAVLFVETVIPPAAVAIHFLLGIPVVCEVVGALEARFYVNLGLDWKGLYPNGELGDKFLWAKDIEGSGTVGAEIQSVLELYGAYVGVYGGGSASLPTELPLRISKVRGYTGVFVGYRLFKYKKEFGVEFSFDEEDGEGLQISGVRPSGVAVWEPIGSSLLAWGEANRLVADSVKTKPLSISAQENGSDTEQKIVENVTVVSGSTAIADSSGTVILFTLHDPEKPWYGATEIAETFTANWESWSLTQITDDDVGDFGPKMAAADSSTGLAAWTRVSGDVSGIQGPDEIAPYLEIYASRLNRNTGIWSAPVQLTDNTVVDRSPLPIVFGANEGVLWIQNEGNSDIGDSAEGDRLVFVPWTGSEWGPSETLWSGQKGILGVSFVSDSEGRGHVVFAVDEDGNLDTKQDRELYWLSTLNGVWQTAMRLTNDDFEDALPTLVGPNGAAACVWRKDAALMYTALGVWNPREVFSEHTDANEAQSISGVTMPGGAAIAYTVQGPQGTDIFAAFYDQALDRWSLPRQLTFDEHAESALSLAFDGTRLVIAYLKTQTERTTKEVEINGQVHQIENVPQPGRTDLYVLRHALGYDPAVVSGSLKCDPPNPAPGETATLQVTVENRGDLACDIHVVFYQGDPNQGGMVIGGETITSNDLVPGGKRDVSISWSIPSVHESQDVFVVVDLETAMEDRDRSNNVTSIRTVLPDLTIESLLDNAVSGVTVALAAKVTNAGVIPAAAGEVSWRVGSESGAEIGRTSIGSISPGVTREISLLWDVGLTYAPGQIVKVYAVVDPGQAVAEFDETNNTAGKGVEVPLTVPRCAHDQDADGDTDGLDLKDFVNGLGTQIDSADLALLAEEFGRDNCPFPMP